MTDDGIVSPVQGIPDDFELDATQARALDIDSIIATVSDKTIHHFSAAFIAARDKAVTEGRELDAHALQLLVVVVSFATNDDPKQPFSPMLQGTGWRSPLPEDLTASQRAALDVILAEVADPELQARLADVLWHQKRRDPRHGRTAVHAYLASARRLFHPSDWTFPHANLKRALAIGSRFGSASTELQEVVEELKATIDRLGGQDPLYFTEGVMSLLIGAELSDSEMKAYRDVATTMASAAAAQLDFRRARAYWMIALKWSNAISDPECAKSLRLQMAESYVTEADNQSSHMLRASTLRNAVKALREAGADKARIETVRATLDDSQELMLSELKPIGIPFDVTALAKGAVEEAHGVDPIEGLWKLAVALVPIPRKAELRDRVETSFQEFSFTYAIQKTHIGSGGRHTGSTPGTIGFDSESHEAVVEHEMLSEAGRLRLLAVTGLIEPMRRELVRRFTYTEVDIFYALRDRMFVPRGRELLWARGVHAGLVGDYATALHLLVPQLDNSLRYVLQLLGVIPYTQTVAGVQDVFKLEDTLGHAKLISALGEDRVFMLKSVLVGRTSANMRNLMGHGLLDDGHASSIDAAYIWWIALHLAGTIGKPPPELAHLVRPAAEQNGSPNAIGGPAAADDPTLPSQ